MAILINIGGKLLSLTSAAGDKLAEPIGHSSARNHLNHLRENQWLAEARDGIIAVFRHHAPLTSKRLFGSKRSKYKRIIRRLANLTG